jgi:tetratricopeptide (TPR) repeat protein
MTMYHSLWAPPGPEELEKGSKLLAIAGTLSKSNRAQQYLDAIGIFYKDWETIDHHTRTLRYEQKMEEIYLSQPSDTEAAIFYALAVRASANPTDKTYKSQRKSGEILERLFLEQPNHPGIAHYIIHTYDYPELAHLGLSTARRYAEIAPSSAHAQHMPSHIFTRLGLWEESISTNLNSASSAVCYSESVAADGNWAQEIHAIDYLVYAYLQTGNSAKVQEQNDYMKSVKKVFPTNNFAVAYTANAVPARIALENKDWEEAANLQSPSLEFDWDNFPWERSILHFAKALGSARSGDVVSAEKELGILDSFHAQLIEMNNAEATYKAGQVAIEIEATKAWINLAKGNKEEALVFMKNAADLESKTSKHPVTPGEVLPADELLADMLLALNKPAEALVAYERNLKGHPGRFNGIYGAAIAAKQSGNLEKASKYFNDLLKLTENSNSDRPELKEAKLYIKNNKSLI